MAKLLWHSECDDDDNEYLEAAAPYQHDGVTSRWRLRQRLANNYIEWYDDSDAGLGGRDTGACWPTQREAIEAMQVAHDTILHCAGLGPTAKANQSLDALNAARRTEAFKWQAFKAAENETSRLITAHELACEERDKRIVSELEKTMQCNCDLDSWEPTQTTGHSRLCRIHKAACKAEATA